MSDLLTCVYTLATSLSSCLSYGFCRPTQTLRELPLVDTRSLRTSQSRVNLSVPTGDSERDWTWLDATSEEPLQQQLNTWTSIPVQGHAHQRSAASTNARNNGPATRPLYVFILLSVDDAIASVLGCECVVWVHMQFLYLSVSLHVCVRLQFALVSSLDACVSRRVCNWTGGPVVPSGAVIFLVAVEIPVSLFTQLNFIF